MRFDVFSLVQLVKFDRAQRLWLRRFNNLIEIDERLDLHQIEIEHFDQVANLEEPEWLYLDVGVVNVTPNRLEAGVVWRWRNVPTEDCAYLRLVRENAEPAASLDRQRNSILESPGFRSAGDIKGRKAAKTKILP